MTSLAKNAATIIILLLVVLVPCNQKKVIAQTQIIDYDVLGISYIYGLLTSDNSEFIYLVEGAGGAPNTLYGASIDSPGTNRTLNTTGVDVSLFTTEASNGRIVVRDFDNMGVHSVDLFGNSAPINMSVEPGFSYTLSASSGVVATMVRGDQTSPNPADRDQVYTRSILGGPAVEITGGIPQDRAVSWVDFSEDGGTMVVGTYDPVGPQPPTPTDVVYFATPGVTGMTEVLTSHAVNTRFIPYGSDPAGDYFVFDTFVDSFTAGSGLWSVSTSNPAVTARLNELDDGSPLSINLSPALDVNESRALFTNWVFQSGGMSYYRLMEVPLDRSVEPTAIAELPVGRRPGLIMPVEGSPWIYLEGENLSPTQEPEFYHAVHSETGDVTEFVGAAGFDIRDFVISPDGSNVLYSDTRTAGNDLFWGQPGLSATSQTVLYDTAETDRIVNVMYSGDGLAAIIALADATEPDDSVANRLLAVPLDGSTPVMIDNGTEGPVTALFQNTVFAPQVADDQLLYFKIFEDAQLGFYVIDIPDFSSSPGDFNNDGVVDGEDFLIWQRGDSPNPNSAEDLADWEANFGGPSLLSAAAVVPEPVSACLLMLGITIAIAGVNRRRN